MDTQYNTYPDYMVFLKGSTLLKTHLSKEEHSTIRFQYYLSALCDFLLLPFILYGAIKVCKTLDFKNKRITIFLTLMILTLLSNALVMLDLAEERSKKLSDDGYISPLI
jgi:hypothetical protein